MGSKCVHMCPRGCRVCVCEGVCLGGGARQVMGSNVASCNTTKLRICPSLTIQPVLKWSRSCDFLCGFVGLCKRKLLTMWWMCPRLYVHFSSHFLMNSYSLRLWFPPSSFALFLSLAFSCCFHCGFVGDLLCFSLPVEKMGRRVKKSITHLH